MLALLDGDSWVYRCGFAAEKTKYLVHFPDGEPRRDWPQEFDNAKDAKKAVETGGVLWSRKEYEPLENCLQMVKTSLENTLETINSDKYKLFLTGRNNFRDEVYSEYKANRDGMVRPKYFRDIRDYLVAQWGAIIVDGREADDELGINATKDTVIVAVDKDLDQIPGKHYNWVTGKSYDISPKEGMTFFYEQLLTGDATDNIPGLYGVGPSRARKILDGAGSPVDMACRVREAYLSNGLTVDVLERNAKLLWIWRQPNDTNPLARHLSSKPA